MAAFSKEKIFVTVGTHPQQFDRLLREIDRLVGNKTIREGVFAQVGNSGYSPKNYGFKKFLTLDEFNRQVKKASVVITHAGEGSIGLCKNMGKKMVVVPRRMEFSEHTNNHQLELARVVERSGIGLVAWNEHDLAKSLAKIKGFSAAGIAKGKIPQLLEKFVKAEFGA